MNENNTMIQTDDLQILDENFIDNFIKTINKIRSEINDSTICLMIAASHNIIENLMKNLPSDLNISFMSIDSSILFGYNKNSIYIFPTKSAESIN